MGELRWNIYPTKDGGSGGYMKLRLDSDADAIKILVMTRGFGQGFCFVAGKENIMWAKGIKGMSDCMKALQKAGYIDRRQIL
jgi:selenophosphate synthase